MATDVEAVLISYLSAKFPSVRFVTDTTADLATSGPQVRINRVGGPTDFTLERASVSVDVFATTRNDSHTLAEQIKDSLTFGAKNYSTVDGSIKRVATISGPSKRPWENTNIKRFGAVYQVFLTPTYATA